MISTLIFGLFVILLWATAEPLIHMRQHITKRYRPGTARGWKYWAIKALNCLPCSSFWLAIPIYYMYLYIPVALEFAIYLSGTTGLITILKNKYWDENIF